MSRRSLVSLGLGGAVLGALAGALLPLSEPLTAPRVVAGAAGFAALALMLGILDRRFAVNERRSDTTVIGLAFPAAYALRFAALLPTTLVGAAIVFTLGGFDTSGVLVVGVVHAVIAYASLEVDGLMPVPTWIHSMERSVLRRLGRAARRNFES